MTPTGIDRGTVQTEQPSIDRRDVLAGALVSASGAVLFVNALSMNVPQAGNQQIGPDVFPLAISALMTVLGLLLVGKGLLRTPGAAPTTATPGLVDGDGRNPADDEHLLHDDVQHVADEVHELMEEPPVPFRRLLVVLGIFVAYLALLIPVGFIISTALFMAATTTFVAPEKRMRNALVAVGVSLVVYFCFSSLLGVELPAGLFGW
jgi:putative tricarboxylic transport membrane protein